MADGSSVSTSFTLLHDLADPVTNQAAWGTFLKRYQPLIYGWCRRVGLNDHEAEEVSAKVLLKLVVTLRSFRYDPARRFRGWLRTVVENEVKSHWRWATRHPADQGSGDSAVHERLENVEAPDGGRDDLGQLEETIHQDLQLAQEVTARVKARVKPRTWQAFWRTAVANEPAREVARSLGISVAAVYMAKSRVLTKVREEGAKLRGEGRGDGGEE